MVLFLLLLLSVLTSTSSSSPSITQKRHHTLETSSPACSLRFLPRPLHGPLLHLFFLPCNSFIPSLPSLPSLPPATTYLRRLSSRDSVSPCPSGSHPCSPRQHAPRRLRCSSPRRGGPSTTRRGHSARVPSFILPPLRPSPSSALGAARSVIERQ